MTINCEFPSDAFPAFPRIRIEASESWTPEHIAGTVIALVNRASERAFAPNVLVRVHRVSTWSTIEEGKAVIDGTIDALPEVSDVGREDMSIGGRPSYRREYVYNDSEAGLIMQAICATVIPHESCADLVQIVGSAAVVDADTVLPDIREILASLTVSHDGT